jgi:hypothetical protein
MEIIHCLIFYVKQRSGDWIRSQSSGGNYSVEPSG